MPEPPPPAGPPPDMEPMPGPRAAPRAERGAAQTPLSQTPPAPAAPEPVAAQPPAGASGVTLERVQGEWPAVIAEIRKTQPTVGVFLQQGALQSVEGGVLTVAFPPESRFHMGQVLKSREGAEQVMAATLGQPLRLNCQVVEAAAGEGQAGGPAAAPNNAPAGGAQRGDRQQVDPTVRSVLDTFDGELI